MIDILGDAVAARRIFVDDCRRLSAVESSVSCDPRDATAVQRTVKEIRGGTNFEKSDVVPATMRHVATRRRLSASSMMPKRNMPPLERSTARNPAAIAWSA